jgi:hypothetical protein
MENKNISDARIDESITPDNKTMNEKTVPAHITEQELHDQSSQVEALQEGALDLYKPFPITEGTPLEDHILTIRAVIVGIVLGSLVSASNLYLGTVADYISL